MGEDDTTSSLEWSSGAQYSHDKLEIPGEQIRLLEISPQQPHKPLELCLSIHSWANIPHYHAISYTWGDLEDPQTVLVNTRPMAVTKNCHYALTQIQLYHARLSGEASSYSPSGRFYLWIDSICIDQVNAEEKGHQVASMGRIYAKASKVLACIGPHLDDSHELAGILDFMKGSPEISSRYGQLIEHVIDFRPPGHTGSRVLVELIQHYVEGSKPLQSGFGICFRKAFLAFANRTYWTRLWIVQEVAATFGTGEKLEVLCGHDSFTRSEVYTLFHVAARLRLLRDSSSVNDGDLFLKFSKHCFRTVMEMDTASPMPPFMLFEKIDQTYKCSKPEDRVFGLLSLIKWPDGVQPIEPVYKPSAAIELAELFLSFSAHCSSANQVLKGLEICHDDLQMAKLVTARSVESKVEEDQHGRLASQNFRIYDTQFRIISRNSANKLTALLDPERRNDRETTLREAEMTSQIVSNKYWPQPLFCHSNIGALLCSEAREYDWIVKTGFGKGLLVIRGVGLNSPYDIIGQGILLNGYDLNYRSRHEVDPNPLFIGMPPAEVEQACKDARKCLQELQANDVTSVPLSVADTNKFAQAAERLLHPWCGLMATFDLHVKPVELLLLAGQDLEKDGTRNFGTSRKRLSTKIYGTMKCHSLTLEKTIPLENKFIN
ncbi:hypothetical protein PFICI_06711 [Pestalotiopsis fici W106-1]|uniref:Heterokaryon incompatibility domain-containing protein n=1 Tax=Pestalotiopsis fici (strain W106-1 / CGMCC3.15140) TaxID=1229662 RepID=W3X6P4_PESFW|nr:uncharacterized protein PFICI_06711 [Pestalotiopsis fici W106-1]ETS81709.1 hypothetical protein PFICI_06711 [Pestalotiopsis fici W106-1]